MILRKIDPQSLDVYNFRKEIICVDENFDIKYLNENIERKKDTNIPEEVWKFSLKKWNSLNLDSLYGLYLNKELAAISGSKLYGEQKNFLRTGMMYYILKRFRKEIRSPLWCRGGLLDATVKDYSNIDYTFISIYAHNNKLKSWVNAFSRHGKMGQLGANKNHIDNLRSFKKYEFDVILKGVPQSIFYRKESSNNISVDQFVSEIKDKYD